MVLVGNSGVEVDVDVEVKVEVEVFFGAMIVFDVVLEVID